MTPSSHVGGVGRSSLGNVPSPSSVRVSYRGGRMSGKVFSLLLDSSSCWEKTHIKRQRTQKRHPGAHARSHRAWSGGKRITTGVSGSPFIGVGVVGPGCLINDTESPLLRNGLSTLCLGRQNRSSHYLPTLAYVPDPTLLLERGVVWPTEKHSKLFTLGYL